jgi:hypothetical protein
VPRLRLYLDQAGGHLAHRFLRPDGSSDVIPCLRLITYANLLRQVLRTPKAASIAVSRCVIDTGAYIGVVPEAVWCCLRPGVVTPLPFEPATPPQLRTITIAGGSYPFDLGEITLRLEDRAGGKLDVRLVAKFTRDGGALAIPLTLGLRGGVLDGRTLRAAPDPAAPFGQAWVLEDP